MFLLSPFLQPYWKALMCLGLTLALSGCSSWVSDTPQAPDIQLTQVDVKKAKLLEQKFVLHFELHNPNWDDLPIYGFNYTVDLNDITLARGASQQWFTIPAQGTRSITVPVTTNLWGNLRNLIRALKEPETPLHYRLSGDLETGMVFGDTLHDNREGDISQDRVRSKFKERLKDL